MDLSESLSLLIASFPQSDEPEISELRGKIQNIQLQVEQDVQGNIQIAGRDLIQVEQIIQTFPEDIKSTLEGLNLKLQVLTDRSVKQFTGFRRIRLFISSPSDVSQERDIVRERVRRVQNEPAYRNHIFIDIVDWSDPDQRATMLATKTPQQAISEGLARPSECDIVVTVLWMRMGTPLPIGELKPPEYRFTFNHPLGDDRYFSGTEWEYVDAVANAMGNIPKVVVYRRLEPPSVLLNDPDIEKKLEQYQLVQWFFQFMEQQSRGYNPYGSLEEFARIFEQDLRNLVSQILLEPEVQLTERNVSQLAESNLIDWPSDKPPFPGLRAFSPADREVFFGREGETTELGKLIEASDSHFISVIGASGSGKSSLIGAGLLPYLKNLHHNWLLPVYHEDLRQWSGFRFTPGEFGNNPFLPVAHKLALLLNRDDADVLAQELEQEPTCIAGYFQDLRNTLNEDAEIVFFIDQFEEIFTLIHVEQLQTKFFELISILSDLAYVRIIITMRADFSEQCAENPRLNRLMQQHENSTYWLSRPNRRALYEMILKPANVAGLYFEDGLDWQILEDTGEDAGSIALTAYALRLLWQHREGSSLTWQAYNTIGGVEGAIGTQAQKAYASLNMPTDQKYAALRRVFARLVTIAHRPDHQGYSAIRKRTPQQEVVPDSNSPEGLLVETLVNSKFRLLTTDFDDQTKEPILAVTHEALFRTWPLLRDWISAAGEAIVLVDDVKRQTSRWLAYGEDSDFSWSYEQVNAALDLLELYPELKGELTSDEWRFLRTEYGELWSRIADPATTHRERAEIGNRLLQLDDIQRRPGIGLVTSNLPRINIIVSASNLMEGQRRSPSYELRLWGEDNTLLGLSTQWYGLPDIVWLPIPTGAVAIKEKVFTMRSCFVSKYPITVCQYEAFLNADDGYADPKQRWWQGLSHYNLSPRTDFSTLGNLPAEVSWNEAVAFCRWLSYRLDNAYQQSISDQENETINVRLPTEWEWQHIACGDLKNFEFPWGNDWESARPLANTKASGLDRPVAVGLYPLGDSPIGVSDLCGNVWEWCLNDYEEIQSVDMRKGRYRCQQVLRGGSWSYPPSAAKHRERPTALSQRDHGFRILVENNWSDPDFAE